MRTFNEFWELLSPKAEYANRKRACFEFWNGQNEKQQEAIYDTIKEKLSKGKFVDFNPLFALMNNSHKDEPTNYRGRAIPAGMKVYSAKWNGSFGMYTAEDIEKFHMERPEG